jgi:hypothetical protein
MQVAAFVAASTVLFLGGNLAVITAIFQISGD